MYLGSFQSLWKMSNVNEILREQLNSQLQPSGKCRIDQKKERDSVGGEWIGWCLSECGGKERWMRHRKARKHFFYQWKHSRKGSDLGQLWSLG